MGVTSRVLKQQAEGTEVDHGQCPICLLVRDEYAEAGLVAHLTNTHGTLTAEDEVRQVLIQLLGPTPSKVGERPTRCCRCWTGLQPGHATPRRARGQAVRHRGTGRRVDAAQVRAALRLLDSTDGDATGLTVVIVHAGADGDYVVIQSWLADYLTRGWRSSSARPGEPDRLRPAPPGFGPRVWEAAVLAHERTAFVGHVLTAPGSSWTSAVPMRGDHVILEPLDLAHVPELLTATADDEVWQHLHLRRPADVTEMTAIVADVLHGHRTGARVPWVQPDARTGAVAGTTSYYDISEACGSVAIDHTITDRPWWRTGLNTEAKLLLLTRPFDELWADASNGTSTPLTNGRTRRYSALGATREGVIRHHHRRQSDGSLRDMVLYSMTADEWPDARARLDSLLRSRT